MTLALFLPDAFGFGCRARLAALSLFAPPGAVVPEGVPRSGGTPQGCHGLGRRVLR